MSNKSYEIRKENYVASSYEAAYKLLGELVAQDTIIENLRSVLLEMCDINNPTEEEIVGAFTAYCDFRDNGGEYELVNEVFYDSKKPGDMKDYLL